MAGTSPAITPEKWLDIIGTRSKELDGKRYQICSHCEAPFFTAARERIANASGAAKDRAGGIFTQSQSVPISSNEDKPVKNGDARPCEKTHCGRDRERNPAQRDGKNAACHRDGHRRKDCES